MTPDKRPELPTVEQIIPPSAKRLGGEQLDAVRARLCEYLEELAKLREFFDNSAAITQMHLERIRSLEKSAAEAAQEHAAALRKAAQQRSADLAFLLQMIPAAGQLAALSQDAGVVTARVQPESVSVKLVFDGATFEASSGEPTQAGVSSDVLNQQIELHERGLNGLELIGIAQLLAWTGTLPEREARQLPRPEARLPEPAPSPLNQFMEAAARAGLVIQLRKE